MQTVSLGLVRVPTPGTPVRITADDTLQVAHMVVRTFPGFTGRVYLGLAGMNKNAANMPGVVSVLSEPPSFGPQDSVVLPPSSGNRGNVIRPADFWIDADVATEGVTVTCFIA
jgi:hypothetical protein